MIQHNMKLYIQHSTNKGRQTWNYERSLISVSFMMTSSNGNVSVLLALYAGNSPVTGEFPHKGEWHRALMFSLICAWINGWVNNREAGDLRHYHTHYDVIVMLNHVLMISWLPDFISGYYMIFCTCTLKFEIFWCPNTIVCAFSC